MVCRAKCAVGVRVPAGAPWPYGRFLFRKRLMGVALSARGLPRPGLAGLIIRRAGPDDLNAVSHVDLIGFPSAPTLEQQWIQPHLAAPGVEVAVAEISGEPVAPPTPCGATGRPARRCTWPVSRCC